MRSEEEEEEEEEIEEDNMSVTKLDLGDEHCRAFTS